MKLALVGVGGAGGRVVDRIVSVERETDRSLCYGNILALDVPPTAFDSLTHIPQDRRILLGGDRSNGATVDDIDGDDPDVAVRVARDRMPQIRRAVDQIELHEMDGVLVVAGLGGGTGAGLGAVVVDEFRRLYERPVYALGLLPSEREGRQSARNAARSLRSIVPMAESTLLFDNHEWHSSEHGTTEYTAVNHGLARRIVTLLAAGELDTARVAENAIDSSDIIRTLSPGGVASVGYASMDLDESRTGLAAWVLARVGVTATSQDSTVQPQTITSLVRRAVNSRLTIPCEGASAERALLLFSGPPGAIPRRGFEHARQWLEDRADTVEVLAGDDPRPSSSQLAVAVLLSNVTEIQRIERLQEEAVATGEPHDTWSQSPETGFE